MIRRVTLVCLAVSLGVVGCGSSDGDGTGGDAGSGSGGVGSALGVRSTGGAGGEGGTGGEGGAGGEPGPEFTSWMDRIDAGLAYQLERCRCQDPAEAISESACLALVHFTELPVSDDQNECFDRVILGEENMTLEVRLACFVELDLMAADCLAEVNECSDSEIAACLEARTTLLQDPGCPDPQDDVLEVLKEEGCQTTTAKDDVDAFLDYRRAECDCRTNCTSADPDSEVEECMMVTLQAERDAHGPIALRCFTEFWRRRAVCFGNEMTCDGAVTACADIPAMDCAIDLPFDLAILNDCL